MARFLVMLFTVFCTIYTSTVFANDMKIFGNLVNTPCKISTNDIEVDFGEIRLLDFYDSNFKLEKKDVTITLSDCDLSISRNFRIKFSGVENLKLPGFLALDNTDWNNGIGIGIESNNGSFLTLNKQSSLMDLLQNGQNDIKFRAYLKVTPEAIKNKTIKPGHFSAKAIFSFEYD